MNNRVISFQVQFDKKDMSFKWIPFIVYEFKSENVYVIDLNFFKKFFQFLYILYLSVCMVSFSSLICKAPKDRDLICAVQCCILRFQKAPGTEIGKIKQERSPYGLWKNYVNDDNRNFS